MGVCMLRAPAKDFTGNCSQVIHSITKLFSFLVFSVGGSGNKKNGEETQGEHPIKTQHICIYMKVPSEQRSCSMIFVDLHLILSWMVDVTRSTCFRMSGRRSEYNFVNRYVMYM